MYKVYHDFERPCEEYKKRFSKLSSPLISDAMGRYNVMHHSIKPVYKGARLCGPALTVNTYTADNLMIHLAIKVAKPGDIIVINNGGQKDTGLWGDLMTVSAIARGIGGIVIEGAVRDSIDIEKNRFPVFSNAISPRGSFKTAPGSINIPISCGGVSVHPGDLIFGDDDGVVVVPLKEIFRVLISSEENAINEKEIRHKLEKGETVYDLMNLEQCLKGKVEFYKRY